MDPALIDHAAQQSDRWLFLAVLALGGLSGMWLFRWLVGRYTELSSRLAAVIEANTEALREMKDVANGCRRK